MSKFKIKKLNIKSFRGIKDFELNLERSLVLCGENGSGKSSIVNAFEYLFTGKVESLAAQSVKPKKSLVYIGDKPENLLVEAKIGKRTIKRTLKEEPQTNDIIEDFKNGSFLLNRKKLLTFIETTPTERYKNITSLIGFEDLDTIEKTLKQTQDQFKNKLKNKQEELDSKIESMTTIYNCEFDEIYDKINEILTKNNLDKIDEKTNIKEFLKKFSKDDFEKINQLTRIIELFNVDILEINNDFEKLLFNYEEATLYELKTTNNLLNILNKTTEFILNENPTNCPICQNKIDSKIVIQNIQIKKKELEKNEYTLNNWKEEYNEFINKLNELNYRINEIKKSLSNLNEYEFNLSLDPLINDLNKLYNFEIKISQINQNTLIEFDNKFKKLKNNIEIDFKKLNDKQNHENLNKIYEIILKIEDKKLIEDELIKIENQYNIAKTTYEQFVEEKKSAIENIIKEIEGEVNKYYNFIHKDEIFNSPIINVPESKKLSLELNFNDIIADPRSYSSEGHLDSLGLCIFLAFAKKFNKYDFLILDDIISTVDLGHKEKIAELLFTEFKNYKFIITTHNKLWLRQIKNIAQKYGIDGGFTFAEIRRLDKDSGPILSKSKIPKQMIETHITNGDTYAAGNSIRRYLESVFEKICRENQIPVPLKDHVMVNDYFEAVHDYFEKIFNNIDPQIETYYKEVFKKLDNSRYLGNLTSHNDEANEYVSIREIESFKDAVFAFEKSMKCNKHNYYLRFDKKAKIAVCSNPTCKKTIYLK